MKSMDDPLVLGWIVATLIEYSSSPTYGPNEETLHQKSRKILEQILFSQVTH